MSHPQTEQLNEEILASLSNLYGEISEISLESDKFALAQDVVSLEPALRKVLAIIKNIKNT